MGTTVVVVLAVVAVCAVIAAVKAVQIIPQGSTAVVERFGRYTRTLGAGLHILVPFADAVRARLDLREQVVSFPPQPVVTRDNLVVAVDTVVHCQVTDARAAVYESASYIRAVEQLLTTALRALVGGMDLDRVLVSRDGINAALHGVLDEAAGRWGIRINRVEVKELEPPAAVRTSAEAMARAEREKRAAILRAEGDRQAAILRAEGEEYAAKGDRAAAVLRAEGDQQAAALRTFRDPGGEPPRVRHQPLQDGDPRRIGRYRLLARLGRGGMGTVYLGRSPGRRLVAVKVILAEFAEDPAFLRRFAREIDAARRVGGFHTAPVVDADPGASAPWLATEYIPGPSLHTVLDRHGPLPAETVRALALGIAEALDGIHACGIIHRDLKPGNVVVSAAGPRVIDFGIARALDTTALTRTNHLIGTPGFLAPEQLTGAAVTPAADLYSFGMVLSRAAGAAPFTDGAARDAALDRLPSELAEIITRCLAHAPAERPSPVEILARLSPDAPEEEPGDWLPDAVRTLVEAHRAPTVQLP